MTFEHKQYAAGRWLELPFLEQMANIGGEIERTVGWRKKGNSDYSRRAFDRALELLDLTIGDHKNKSRLREITRVREALADFFVFDNSYGSTEQSWRNYFLVFNVAARADR
jgi:hypothetical protein